MGRRGSKYCEKCGCYIPEGETACVSCGYDFITKIVPTSKPSSELTVNDFDELLGTYSRYHTIEHKEAKYIPCENSSTALTYSKSTDWVYPYQFNTLLAPKVRFVTIHDIYDKVTPSGE